MRRMNEEDTYREWILYVQILGFMRRNNTNPKCWRSSFSWCEGVQQYFHGWEKYATTSLKYKWLNWISNTKERLDEEQPMSVEMVISGDDEKKTEIEGKTLHIVLLLKHSSINLHVYII